MKDWVGGRGWGEEGGGGGEKAALHVGGCRMHMG